MNLQIERLYVTLGYSKMFHDTESISNAPHKTLSFFQSYNEETFVLLFFNSNYDLSCFCQLSFKPWNNFCRARRFQHLQANMEVLILSLSKLPILRWTLMVSQ